MESLEERRSEIFVLPKNSVIITSNACNILNVMRNGACALSVPNRYNSQWPSSQSQRHNQAVHLCSQLTRKGITSLSLHSSQLSSSSPSNPGTNSAGLIQHDRRVRGHLNRRRQGK